MIKIISFWLLLVVNNTAFSQIYLPMAVPNRSDENAITLTDIGTFGMLRKARPNVPAHLHTGIDIKRPFNNYNNEPIFPIAKGIVISLRDDGPYAQIIVAHEIEGMEFYSVYEHIAGIDCSIGEVLSPDYPLARFMNKEELNKYGWQFDHFHLEIMKVEPSPRKPDVKLPHRYYSTYWLSCFTSQDLDRFYWNPLDFFRENL